MTNLQAAMIAAAARLGGRPTNGASVVEIEMMTRELVRFLDDEEPRREATGPRPRGWGES